jgi:TatD DNase family protein
VIDTHCHLDVERFEGDRDDVLHRAWAAGLTGILIPAIGPHAWASLQEWPQRDARIQVGLGIHPQWLAEMDERDDEKALAELDAQLDRGRAIAVGECGLDGPTEPHASMQRQLAVFDAHVQLARKHRLPLLVHCYRAHPHLQRYLKHTVIPEAGLLLHSYSGSAELTPFYVDRGCHFSFAGAVTLPEARRPLEALRRVPTERLLAETDAPDQPPHPHRGTRNEPAHLPLVIDAMSQALGRDVREIITINSTRLFPAFASKTGR